MPQEVDQMLKSGRRLEAHWGGSWREEVDVEGDKQARSVLSIHRIHEHSALFGPIVVSPQPG
jgi:hypothetical protein